MCSSTNKTSLNKVYLMQMKFVRPVGGIGFSDLTVPFFNEHNLVTVFNTSYYFRALLVYRCLLLNHEIDWLEILKNLLITPCRYSFAHNLIVPSMRTTRSKQSMAYTGLILWGSLPLELNMMENLTVFMVRLIKHFLRQNDLWKNVRL